MNFIPNIPIDINDLIYRLNEMDTKIKKLEQRIIILEKNNHNINYQEPDTSLYMI